MLKLTAPVLRNAATSRARLQTGRFCALSPPENNALAQPPRSSKAAFWRFSPVQRTDLEGQQRVRHDLFGKPSTNGRSLRILLKKSAILCRESDGVIQLILREKRG